MLDILSDKMTGGKLLVFAHHRNVLDALEQGVLKSGHVEYIRIDGRTKVSMRRSLLVLLPWSCGGGGASRGQKWPRVGFHHRYAQKSEIQDTW